MKLLYGDGVFSYLNSSYIGKTINVYYDGYINIYNLDKNVNIYKMREYLSFLILKESDSQFIFNYIGEFKPYKAIAVNINKNITLKPLGMSYWEHNNIKWEDDNIEWQDDRRTYTHIISLNPLKRAKMKNRMASRRKHYGL